MKHGNNMKGKVNRMKKFEKITLWTATEGNTLGVTALDILTSAIESATTPWELTLLDYDAEEYELVKKDEKGKRNE